MSRTEGSTTPTRPKARRAGKPKNVPADGTAKGRWSAAERADRGRPPRRSAGRNAAAKRPDTRIDHRPDRRLDRGSNRASVPSDDRRSSLDQMTWSEPTAVAPLGTSSSVPDVHDRAHDGFGDLGLPTGLVDNLRALGITTPFPIQATTIPDAMAGRDVLGRARTGSGKTLAFGLPMITRLAQGPRSTSPRGLVLVPTRELALQVADALAPLARSQGLRVALVTGGMAYGPQIRALESGSDLVVATPGRLIDLLEQGVADLGRVEVTVLDEADHMADLGFLPAVTQILDAVPSTGQRLLFSATLDRAVGQLVRRYLSDPVTHEVDPAQASVTTMAHRLVQVAPADKVALTADVAGRAERTVVFVRTQRGADRVADQLRAVGVLAGALHGGLTQGARARILAAFKEGRLPVLVATDVAARGIHVDGIDLVLQVDPPHGPKEYLHRSGRTARAGAGGQVLTLVLPPQRRDVTRLVREAGVSAETLAGRLGESWLTGLGSRVEAAPVERATFERVVAPSTRAAGPKGARGRAGRGSRRPATRRR
jgi:superfamily II DNA/RNA helicase